MDFSGDYGRIVHDPKEAIDALVTDAQGWKVQYCSTNNGNFLLYYI